jgi:general L-amino acid transport system permease protein
MSIESRSPPPQLAFRLKRALGGRAGWGGFALQIIFVVVLIWIGYEIIANARANLETQHITSGFGFLKNTAGFDVSQSLIPYSGSDPYTRVFLVGLLNTLLVSVIGIVFATVIGFIVALCRLSPNWLLSRIGGAYVEGVRNVPVLFQILFWYLAVLAALPGPRQSISLFGSFCRSRLAAVRAGRTGCDQCIAPSAPPCAPAIIRVGQVDRDLALCGRHADRPAAVGRLGVRRSRHV